MDAAAAITAIVARLPPTDVAALLAARGLPSVVHGRAPARAHAALTEALQAELCDWEWESSDGVDDGDDCLEHGPGFHAGEVGRRGKGKEGGHNEKHDHGPQAHHHPFTQTHTEITSTNGALVACGNSIIAVGGMDAARREHAAVWRWDLSPTADAVGFTPLRPLRGAGDEHPPSHPAGIFAAAHDGEVWAFPGPGNADLTAASVLDPDTGAWRRVRVAGRPPADDFVRRTVVGVTDGAGHLWALGGPSLDRAACFDFATATWTRTPLSSAPASFVFGGAAWHGGALWVYGGTGEEADAPVGVWRVDLAAPPARRAWRRAKPPPGSPPLPPFRLHSASAVVGHRWIVHGGRSHAPPQEDNNRLAAAAPWRPPPGRGGWLSPFQVVGTAHEFDFRTHEWRPLLADGVPAPPREWHAGLGLADCAVFVGGRTDIAIHDGEFGESEERERKERCVFCFYPVSFPPTLHPPTLHSSLARHPGHPGRRPVGAHASDPRPPDRRRVPGGSVGRHTITGRRHFNRL